jgi:hypothetical protein
VRSRGEPPSGIEGHEASVADRKERIKGRRSRQCCSYSDRVRTPPQDIDVNMVAGLVTAHWAVQVHSMEYAAVGAGGHHWWASTSVGELFVTLDDLRTRGQSDDGGTDGAFRRLGAAMGTARSLHDEGLDFVAAPMVDMDGSTVVRWRGHFAVSITPRVQGHQHGWGAFEPEERDAVLRRLSVLHSVRPAVTPERDDFQLQGGAALTSAITGRYREWDSGPYGEGARGLLVRRYDAVVDALGRLRLLTGSVKAREDRFVVTHGEPHRGNVIDAEDGPVLVDWDTARLAPAERDLWWFAGKGDTLDAYEAAGGQPADPTALEYYRLRWTLTDLALFTDELRRAHADDEDSQLAWDALQECYRVV